MEYSTATLRELMELPISQWPKKLERPSNFLDHQVHNSNVIDYETFMDHSISLNSKQNCKVCLWVDMTLKRGICSTRMARKIEEALEMRTGGRYEPEIGDMESSNIDFESLIMLVLPFFCMLVALVLCPFFI